VTPGTVLSGKYKLVSLLGEGGMGAVWRAEDLRLGGAPVAIKLMHSRDAAQPEIRARFEQEVRTAARLRHPHVAQVYDVGVDEQSGAPFFAMELLEGETLKERLVRGGVLGPAELARVVSHVAHGLSRAHELGIVHRDLKPANIFLVQNADGGQAKVLDFGIAKRMSHSLMHGATATGMVLGTPFYMSPEQILSSKDVDHRSDVWSLAVIACESLTGRLPFEADNLPGLSLAICQGRPTLPSLLGPVPPGFDVWFERATSLDRQQRFDSVLQMAQLLREVCGTVESQRSASGAGARDYAAAGLLREPARSSPSTGPLSRTATGSRQLGADTLAAPVPLWRRWRWVAAAAALVVVVVAVAARSWLYEPGLPEAALPSGAAEPAAVQRSLPDPAHVELPAQPPVDVRALLPEAVAEPRVTPIAPAPAPAAVVPEAAPPTLEHAPPEQPPAVPSTRLTPAAPRGAKPKPAAAKRTKPPQAAPRAAPARETPAAPPPASSAPPDGLSPF
jgi:serine/threonine-protein kinase